VYGLSEERIVLRQSVVLLLAMVLTGCGNAEIEPLTPELAGRWGSDMFELPGKSSKFDSCQVLYFQIGNDGIYSTQGGRRKLYMSFGDVSIYGSTIEINAAGDGDSKKYIFTHSGDQLTLDDVLTAERGVSLRDGLDFAPAILNKLTRNKFETLKAAYSFKRCPGQGREQGALTKRSS
jgi:hypothetical protein